MDEQIKDRLTRRAVWMRALFMVLFAVAYGIAELVVGIVIFIQFLMVLFTGHANQNLLRLGLNLSAYIYQVLQFQTFHTETRPFPFGDWPSEDVGENPWTEAAATASPADEQVEREHDDDSGSGQPKDG